MAKRTDKLTDAVLRCLQELLVQHGEPGRPMKQKTLARRSGQSYARVHRFLSGQMPYPPISLALWGLEFVALWGVLARLRL